LFSLNNDRLIFDCIEQDPNTVNRLQVIVKDELAAINTLVNHSNFTIHESSLADHSLTHCCLSFADASLEKILSS
jgi:hypothetical protein